MHLQLQNYVEAGLTLRLHSDLYEWNLHSFVPPMEDLGLPQQSQFHRKETLCLLILDYLGKSLVNQAKHPSNATNNRQREGLGERHRDLQGAHLSASRGDLQLVSVQC